MMIFCFSRSPDTKNRTTRRQSTLGRRSCRRTETMMTVMTRRRTRRLRSRRRSGSCTSRSASTSRCVWFLRTSTFFFKLFSIEHITEYSTNLMILLYMNDYDYYVLFRSYRNIVKDRFERCLDLYLCPRVRRSRINVTSESLVPQLPDTSELRPFPNEKSQDFLGHTERVRSIDVSPDGQWVVSGSEDKTVRVWEVATGRCVRTWNVGSKAVCVQWNPNASDSKAVIAAAVGREMLLICPRAPEKAPEVHFILCCIV